MVLQKCENENYASQVRRSEVRAQGEGGGQLGRGNLHADQGRGVQREGEEEDHRRKLLPAGRVSLLMKIYVESQTKLVEG